MRPIKYLLNGIMTTFATKLLSKGASKDVLKAASASLLSSIFNRKLTNPEECEAIVNTINIRMLKMIKNSDDMSCFWYVMVSLLSSIRPVVKGAKGCNTPLENTSFAQIIFVGNSHDFSLNIASRRYILQRSKIS